MFIFLYHYYSIMEFMEFQCFGQGSSFHRNSHDSFEDPFLQYEKYPCIPV